jgi:hypothetical protein
LSVTQFSTLNSAGINDPEGPEKYNNTEVTLLELDFRDVLHTSFYDSISFFIYLLAISNTFAFGHLQTNKKLMAKTIIYKTNIDK